MTERPTPGLQAAELQAELQGWLRADEGRQLIAGRLRDLAELARYRRSQAVEPETVRLLDAVCSNLGRSLADVGAAA